MPIFLESLKTQCGVESLTNLDAKGAKRSIRNSMGFKFPQGFFNLFYVYARPKKFGHTYEELWMFHFD